MAEQTTESITREWEDHQRKIEKEIYRDTLIETGKTKEEADRLAEITPPPVTIDESTEDPALVNGQVHYRDTLLSTGACKTREQADRMAGVGGVNKPL